MRIRTVAAVAAVVALLAAPAGRAAGKRGPVRDAVRHALLLNGKPFRFGGANIEWLGLAGYGPADPAGPRYPTHFEIDDALATAKEMGARVVRARRWATRSAAQLCIEPALGRFNDAAFEPIDYALRSARAHGLRVIATIVGDDARAGGSGCVYLRWRASTCRAARS